MKAFAVCICVLALACFSSAQTTGQRLKQMISKEDNFNTCMDENDMVIEDWYTDNNLINGEYEKSGNEERRRQNACAFECILKKEGLMVGSDIKENKVHAKISKEMGDGPRVVKAHRVARKCMREVKNMTQECEKGFSLLVCLVKETDKEERNISSHTEHENK